MHFKITHKLFLLILLPIGTLIFFSINNIADKYAKLNNDKLDLQNLELFQQLDTLIYFLQLERLHSLKFINMPDTAKEVKDLREVRIYTDKILQKFKKSLLRMNQLSYAKTASSYIQSIDDEFEYLDTMRTSVEVLKMEDYIVYDFYDNINQKLLLVLYNYQFENLSLKASLDLSIMKKIIHLRKYADEERVVGSKILSSVIADPYDYELFNTLLVYQNNDSVNLEFLVQKHSLKQEIQALNQGDYFDTFSDIRDAIADYDYTNTDTRNLKARASTQERTQWINTSTLRIDDLGILKRSLVRMIKTDIHASIDTNQSLLNQFIFISSITIFLLLLGAYYVSASIKSSIKELEIGINKFFEYLNFNSGKPDAIIITTSDELADISHGMNEQIIRLEKKLIEDESFINEITHILSLMQDGNFDEKVYFEPHNPNLKELKDVLNQLIQLISDKIQEQTLSLETLNSSLEQRVSTQTLELEKQVKEITIAMNKAIQAEIAKDEFLANMSHEIRTPLNAILGFVTILQKQIKDEKSLNYLNIIDTSGKSLLGIINDILDFSKIQSGKFLISPHEVDIVEEMSHASQLFASKAYEKHLIYDVYIDVNMPQTVKIDVLRVKQIFSNILSNAMKFTPQYKSIVVNVIIENSQLIISVEDTGIGIAKENLSKVFSAFEQADGSTTRQFGGTGLGLSISHKLAQLMYGDLSLRSTLGIGSTFTFKIPLEIINQEPKQRLEHKKLGEITIAILDTRENSIKLQLIKRYLIDCKILNILELSEYQKDGYDLLFFVPDDSYNEEIVNNDTPAIAILRTTAIKLANLDHIHPLYAPFTPTTIAQVISESNVINKTVDIKEEVVEEDEIQFEGSILVVEDNKTNQMLISILLDDFGLEYTIANNGVEGVSKFKEEKFDLVLMDENMPELNGIGATKQIKAYEENNSLTFTPIIALTASVLETDKAKFLDAGMDGFVAKPIDIKELTSQLSRFLKKIN